MENCINERTIDGGVINFAFDNKGTSSMFAIDIGRNCLKSLFTIEKV